MSNYLNSSYEQLTNLNEIVADSVISSEITSDDLTVSNTTSLYNLIMYGDITAHDIVQSGSYKINQSSSTGVNLMSDIYFNNDSSITMYQSSAIKQYGGTAQNYLTRTNITGLLSLTGNLIQDSGSNILTDSYLGNITQSNTSISQSGTGISNTLQGTTISSLTITESIVLPSNVSLPGSTYNNNNINQIGTSIINQIGTGTNIFKSSDFTDLVLFDGNITQTNTLSVATLKNTLVSNLQSSGNITQYSGISNLQSVISNDLTINDNYDLIMGGDGIITQTGTGTNLLKSTNISGNLYVSGSFTSASGSSYATTSYVDKTDISLQTQITTLNTKTSVITYDGTTVAIGNYFSCINGATLGNGNDLCRVNNNCNVFNCLRVGYADSTNVLTGSSNNAKLDVAGNIYSTGTITGTTINSTTLNATNVISRKLTAGYMMDGAVGVKFSYVPIIASLKYINPEDVDDAWVLEPGYKLVVYIDVLYGGLSYTMNNYAGTTPLYKTSVELVGYANVVSSYKLYYLLDSNEITYANMS